MGKTLFRRVFSVKNFKEFTPPGFMSEKYYFGIHIGPEKCRSGPLNDNVY